MQTDATRACELVVGLRDVTVLSVNAGYVEDIEDSASDNASTTKRTARPRRLHLTALNRALDKWLFGIQRGAVVASSTQLGLPA